MAKRSGAAETLILLGLALVGCSRPDPSGADRDARAVVSAAPSSSSSKPASSGVGTSDLAAPIPSASAAPAVTDGARSSASASLTLPASLEVLFDGEPDLSVALTSPVPFGQASLRLAPGWEYRESWDSVDYVRRADGMGHIVLVRLELTEARLDHAAETWTRKAFEARELRWQSPIKARLGRTHREVRVREGRAKLGEKTALFWEVAVLKSDARFGVVGLAAIVDDAPATVRSEAIASLRTLTLD